MTRPPFDDDDARSGPRWVSGAGEDPGTGDPEVSDGHPFDVTAADRYERGSLIGAGGMGRVLSARDRRLNRLVALKEIAPGQESTEVARRLAQEAWITAQLEHPGIVPVYDAGRSPEGGHFYTMRLIRGRSLGDAIGAADGWEQRSTLLRHFLDVCEAVAYAHSVGVIHRDLKPDNVMVGGFGETQVMDWGLARPIGDADDGAPTEWGDVVPAEHAARTIYGAVVGTPAYMSPEQARGEPLDARTDVWSLGTILYQLLTGSPAFGGSGTTEILAAVRDDARPEPPIDEPEAPPELVAIVRRAMARRREGRYADAGGLARDVERYLDGRRVTAYSYSTWDLVRRLASQWRAPLVVAGVALAIVAAVAVLAYQRTVDERDRALAAEQQATAARLRADLNLARALIEQAVAAAAHDARPEAEVLAARALELTESPPARGVLAAFGATPRPRLTGRADVPQCRIRRLSPDAARLVCIDDDSVSLWSIADRRRLWRLANDTATSALFLAGDRLALVTSESQLTLRDGATGAELASTLETPTTTGIATDPGGRYVLATNYASLWVSDTARGVTSKVPWCEPWGSSAMALAADGGPLVVMCSNNTILVGAPMSGPARTIEPVGLEGFGEPTALGILPGGERVVIGDVRGHVASVDLGSGEVMNMIAADVGPIRSLQTSAAGRVLVVGESGGARVWHADRNAWLGRLPSVDADLAWLSPDGAEVVTVGGRTLKRWRLPETSGPNVFRHGSGLSGAVPSPDGKALVSTMGDGRVRVTRVADGAHLTTLRWGPRVAKPADFTPDGVYIAAIVLTTPGIHVLRGDTFEEIDYLPKGLQLRRVCAMADGVFIGSSYSEDLQVWRWPGVGRGSFERRRVPAIFKDISRDPAGRFAVLVDEKYGGVYRFRAGDELPERLWTDRAAVAADILSDGETIAVAHDRAIRLHGLGGDLRWEHRQERATFLDVALSPDGRWVVAGDKRGEVFVWRAGDGGLVARLRAHSDRVPWLAFTADGRELFTSSWDRTARRWDTAAFARRPKGLAGELERAWGLTLEAALGDVGN